MKYFLFFVLIIFSSASFAQETALPFSECRILPDYKSQDNVAYKAGVDVHGKSVVPADINASQIDVPETMVVPLTVDMARGLSGAGAKGIGLEGTMGFLEVFKNGRVTYNGTDITPQVYQVCGQSPPENLTPTGLSDDGQKPSDVIRSGQVKTSMDVPVAPEKQSLDEILNGGKYND